MLLGIPGDNTYSNYKEANLAFWRLTILPLVQKMAASLSVWLDDPFQTEVTVRPDLDRVPALSAERDALWARLEGASFATGEEKRQPGGAAAMKIDRKVTIAFIAAVLAQTGGALVWAGAAAERISSWKIPSGNGAAW